MARIYDLPNEIILIILINGCFLLRDHLALARTCRNIYYLTKEHEQHLSTTIAKRQFFTPHRVLGFGGGIPSFRNLMTLDRWNDEVLDASSRCYTLIHSTVNHDKYATSRPVWFTPFWREYLTVGLLLFKKLSLSGSILKQLEQLPHQCYALLRFTSIVIGDISQAHCALLKSHSGAGERPPSDREDLGWRVKEIELFTEGTAPFLALMASSNPLLGTNHAVIARGSQYYRRLDKLCLAHAVDWGDADFWENFDPWGVKDRGLYNDEALREMVKQLPE